jgi:hypothetical protein
MSDLRTATRIATVVMLALSAIAQTQSAAEPPIPRFEDYPVAEIFSGTPVAPVLATPQQRLFRTMIRTGVTAGRGVYRDGKEQAGPNFAGQYIIMTWNCGSPCMMMAIVDAKTGAVYNSPMTNDLQMSWLDGGPWLPQVQFRRNSRLVIMIPVPAMARRPIFTHYFLWKENRWTPKSSVRAERFADRV